MALMKKDIRNLKYFSLTGLDGAVVFVKTDQIQSLDDMLEFIETERIKLSQLNVEIPNKPQGFIRGFFISAKEMDEKSISTRYNKLWEIL